MHLFAKKFSKSLEDRNSILFVAEIAWADTAASLQDTRKVRFLKF